MRKDQTGKGAPLLQAIQATKKASATTKTAPAANIIRRPFNRSHHFFDIVLLLIRFLNTCFHGIHLYQHTVFSEFGICSGGRTVLNTLTHSVNQCIYANIENQKSKHILYKAHKLSPFKNKKSQDFSQLSSDSLSFLFLSTGHHDMHSG